MGWIGHAFAVLADIRSCPFPSAWYIVKINKLTLIQISALQTALCSITGFALMCLLS